MPTRREQVLAATVDVLAAAGGHGLTHRAVDRAAGLPEGSTSNHFRTRDALFAAALEQLSTSEATALAALGPGVAHPADRAALVRTLADMVGFLLGPGRALTVARHALFLEAAVRPSLRPALVAASTTWWDLLAGALRGLGCDRADQRGRLLLAYVDGLLADQLARPSDDFDAADALDLGLTGLLPAAVTV